MFIWLFTINPTFKVYIIISIVHPNIILICILVLINLDKMIQSHKLSSFI